MPPTDNFRSSADRATDHFPINGTAITPNDSVDLGFTTRSIWVGMAGHIEVIPLGKTTPVIYKNVPAGRFRIRATRVRAAGTTATDLVGEE
jgi:hypothetical protein